MFLTAAVSFSIKSKEDAAPTSLKPVLPLEQSSDEEPDEAEKNANNDFSLNLHEQQKTVMQQSTPFSMLKSKVLDDSTNHSPTDIEQSDSFIRDAMLEQQNRDEKRQIKRGTIFSCFAIHFMEFLKSFSLQLRIE